MRPGAFDLLILDFEPWRGEFDPEEVKVLDPGCCRNYAAIPEAMAGVAGNIIYEAIPRSLPQVSFCPPYAGARKYAGEIV